MKMVGRGAQLDAASVEGEYFFCEEMEEANQGL